ncbi:hypothetical protein [Clostridium sp. 001]|uniref:hypothetical protein n=1 Tax=Clostridium sp. 001 TaxID=1970093 RepID=UPI001C2C56ED|nr:hypothetical protein [Clostridium sp. 001]QXE18713.1 hypothetical protein B5S50_07605 [Clostridium sp. 001]
MIIEDYKINIEYFKENQMLDNRAIGCGIYIIELLKDNSKEAIPLYIGQSLYMVKRGGEHLYEFFKEPGYLGLSEDNMIDSHLKIRFRILEKCVPDDRSKRETAQIIKIHPLIQKLTNDNMLDIDNKKRKVKEALEKLQTS